MKRLTVKLTKEEIDLIIMALEAMGDRVADATGYSAGEKYWDLEEYLEDIYLEG